MKHRPQKQNEQRPPQPPIRIGRVTFRDGALDLDEDLADEIRQCVATRAEPLSRALGCLMSLEDLDDAATRCAKYLEQAMQKGDHAAVERFASLLFAIDVTAKAHGDELAHVWPPGPPSRRPTSPAVGTPSGLEVAQPGDAPGDFSLEPPSEEDVQAAAARAQAEREAEEAAAAELEAERAALVARGPG